MTFLREVSRKKFIIISIARMMVKDDEYRFGNGRDLHLWFATGHSCIGHLTA